ncbi:MAG: bifunctional (p)ppGpp synthetase/guanosine-3',5'-bis(diphosphate) 3'-pyrophosphohydrolase [Candidatus Riesia sp.]|nr:bifunctional (p)ppGpp synthetase/guanosine-3',5'-bis(diphosphate) 3'-pyrophosphohydrolase [Candidatus Riesia sp.]
MTNLERALMVAEKAHAGQSYDIYPYMYHVKQVVRIATELGYDESILVSCALHDTLEDTELSYNDIKKAFGEEVAEIVYAVTDELGRNRDERKRNTYPKIRDNWKATVVKICDRIANMQQSLEYNSRLFKMYQEENETFCSYLMSKHHPHIETNKAWVKLNTMVKNQNEKPKQNM